MNLLWQQIKKLCPDLGMLNDEALFKLWYEIKAMIDGISIDGSSIIGPINSTEQKEIARRLSAISIFDIIRIVPFYISSPREAIGVLKRQGYKDKDYSVIAETIILIREHYLGGGITKNKVRQIYQVYKSMMKNNGASPMTQVEFEALIKTVVFVKVDQLSVERSLGFVDRDYYGKLKQIRTDDKNDIINVMANELNLHYNERAEFCADCFDEEVTTNDLVEKYTRKQFSVLCEEDAEKSINEIENRILRETPLNIAKSLYTSKVTMYYSGNIKIATQKTRRSTNTPIEVGPFLDTLISCIKRSEAKEVLVCGASPFFIETLIDEKVGVDKIVFALSDPEMCYLLESHYENEDYCSVIPNGVSFVCSEDLFEEVNLEDSVVCFASEIDGDKHMIQLVGNIAQYDCDLIMFGTDEFCKNCGKILGLQNQTLITFPSKAIEASGRKYCSMIKREAEMDGITRTYSVKNAGDEDGVQLLEINEGYEYSSKEFFAGSKTLRETIKDSSRSGGQRKAPITVQFSPEIVVAVAAADDNGRKKGKAYIKSNNKQVENSVVSFRCGMNEVENWAIYVYPFKIVKRRDGELVEIRRVIRETIQNETDGIPVSFRTLWYCTLDIEDYFTSRENAVLKEVMLSDIGLMNPIQCSPGQIEVSIEKVFGDRSSSFKELVISILAKLTSLSVETGHTLDDNHEDWTKDFRIYRAGRVNIARQLKRRSLDRKQNQDLYRTIMTDKNIITSKQMRMAVYMRLIWGLEAEAISALDKTDVRIREGNYQISINKVCSADGQSTHGVRRASQRRILPCTKQLEVLIKDSIAELDLTEMKEKCNTPLCLAQDGRRITPREITECCKEILRCLGIDDAFVYIQNEKKELRRINLSEMSADVFRGNFSLWGRREAMMWNDETNYILGVEKKTTAGKHYIDFDNEWAQIRLRERLQIIENMFKGYYDE